MIYYLKGSWPKHYTSLDEARNTHGEVIAVREFEDQPEPGTEGPVYYLDFLFEDGRSVFQSKK